jgi:hypothetical protein
MTIQCLTSLDTTEWVFPAATAARIQFCHAMVGLMARARVTDWGRPTLSVPLREELGMMGFQPLMPRYERWRDAGACVSGYGYE